MAEIGETDRVEYMIFHLAVDERTLQQEPEPHIPRTSELMDRIHQIRAEAVQKYFKDFLFDVLYPNTSWWVIGYPEEAPGQRMQVWPETYQVWKQEVAVLRRPDEDAD